MTTAPSTLTQPYPRTRKSVPMAPVALAPPASNGFTCQVGSLVAIDLMGGTTSGQAVRSDPSNGFAGLGHLVFLGVAQQLINNAANASPAPPVPVTTGIHEVSHGGNLDGTEPMGVPLYAVDDTTCDKVDRNATLPPLGFLVRHIYDSSGNYLNKVEVAIFPPLHGARGQIIAVKKRILAPGGSGAGAYVLSAAAGSETIALPTLPQGAVFLGGSIECPTLFSGGGASAVTLDINGTSTQTIINGCNVFTGATGFPKFSPLGADVSAGFMADLSGVALTAKINVTGANVSALTAGEVRIRLRFLRAS